MKVPLRLDVRIFVAWHAILRGKQVLRIEPRIQVQQVEKGSDQQSSSYEQNDRDRHLGNHKRTTKAITACRFPGSPSASTQRIMQVRIGTLQRRQQSEQNPGQQ